MQTKTKVIIIVVALAASFIAGRYSRPAKIVTEVKTVEVEKKTSNTDQTVDKHKDTTVTKTVNKDGTVTEVEHTVEDTGSHTKSNQTDNISESTDNIKTVVNNDKTVHLAVLAGANFSNLSVITYGGYASKDILGPVSVGIWGLSLGAGGVSVGFSF